MLIIPVAPFFSGVWCHNMGYKISALKELYYFLNVWKLKSDSPPPKNFKSVLSALLLFFPILKSVEIQKTLVC